MDISNSPAMLNALRPVVAIANNAPNKRGAPGSFKVIRGVPGFKDLWQLHIAPNAGDLNSAEELIANPEAACKGNYIKLTAESNGAFTVTNSRNNVTKTYKR
jgi:hypothetical protein